MGYTSEVHIAVPKKDEQGKYHKELVNSLNDAIKQLKPIIKY